MKNKFKTSPLVIVVLIFLCFIAVFPIYWMFVSSLKTQGTILDSNIIPKEVTLDNYRQAFSAMPMARMIFNSFFVSIVTTLAKTATGVGFSYAFSQWEFRGKKFIYTLMILSWLIPLPAIMIPNYVQVAKWDLNKSLWGIILPNLTAVMVNLQLLDAFKSFPKSLIQAAKLDGSSSWRILWDIIVPNMAPTIASMAIVSFINSWNEYLWPMLMSGKPETSLIQIGLKSFIGGDDAYMYGALTAASTIATIPVLLIYTFLQRQIQDNLVKGGIK